MRRTVIKSEPDEEDVTMEEDSADEVVREINVLLSPALASQLYLIQFPLKPQQQLPLPQAARIKKGHGMIELDERTPDNAGNEGLFSLQHRTHTSQTIPVSTHMALGKMSETGELHLVPLSHIEQMRPSFSHVNETQEEQDVPEKEVDKLEKKPIMLQKKETERAALARKSSFAYKKASEDSEAWKMLIVCDPDTNQYKQAKDSIKCPSSTNPLASVDASGQELDASSSYVHSLNYLPPAVHDVDEVAPESELRQLCARLTVALQRGWPVPYSVLKSQFEPVVGQDLLTVLSSCAVLVRGNFALQSRLMPLTPALQQARTFILFLLQRMGHVERVRLEHVFHNVDSVTSEAIQMLLEQVASRGVNGWQPKVEDNLELYNLFPEQTQLHSQYWERQEMRFADLLELYNQVEV